MSTLTVLQAGFSSLQGPGLFGSQRYGVGPGGAMDRLALAESNALTGQSAGAIAIEIGLLPLRLQVAGGPVRIGVSGAERDIFIDEQQVPLGVTAVAGTGQRIVVRGARTGRFSYLSVQGGLEAPGIRKGTAGEAAASRGHRHARALHDGTVLTAGQSTHGVLEQRLRLPARSHAPIRAILGPQQDYFSADAIARFLMTPWKVSHASDRMAYALEGAPLPLDQGFNIVSDGTVTGSIQINGGGQPLVNLCDRGTTGGYPKIATIISADLGRFAQTPVGGVVRFAPVAILEAQVAARDFASGLANVSKRVEPVRSSALSLAALLDCNVAGDVVDAEEFARRWPESGDNGLRGYA